MKPVTSLDNIRPGHYTYDMYIQTKEPGTVSLWAFFCFGTEKSDFLQKTLAKKEFLW